MAIRTSSDNVISSNEYGSVTYVNLNKQASIIDDAINIEHQLGNAQISLYGGQVLQWQPKDQQPVLWLSKEATYTEGKAIRGGIPICWPWFGPHPKDLTSGNHGFARNKYWQLEEVCIAENEVKIVLFLTGDEEHALWRTPFILKQELIFSNEFTQTLSMTNLSDNTVQYSGALHSYFAVGDPSFVNIDNLDDVFFYDQLSGKTHQKEMLVNCQGPIDRIYHDHKPMVIVDQKWNRKLQITSSECHQWVLWNPGKELANKMADVHLNGENEYVCLEAANTTLHDIPPQSHLIIGQSIKIL